MPSAVQGHLMLVDNAMSTVNQGTTLSSDQNVITYMTEGSGLRQQAVGGALSHTWSVTGVLDRDYDADASGIQLEAGPVSYFPALPTALGDKGWASQVPVGSNYSPGLTVGDLQSYTWGMTGSGSLLFVENLKTYGSETVSGNAAGYQLGAATAAQTIYYIVQCDDKGIQDAGATSPTLDITISSAATDSWPGTTRFTVPQITDAGAAWKYDSLAGAVTDTWWRVEWTIGGTGGPTFPFQVVMAIA